MRKKSEAIEAHIYQGKVVVNRSPAHRYKVAIDGEKAKPVPSVTTILGQKAKNLLNWAQGCCADRFMELMQDRKQMPSNEELLAMKEEVRKAPQAVSEKAMEAGTQIHTIVENYLRSGASKSNQSIQHGIEDLPLNAKMALSSFEAWIRKNNVYPLVLERLVYSKKHNYVGQVDNVLVVNGRVGVWDIKTGKSFYSEVILQTAAYASALMEENVMPVADPDRGVLLFERGSDGELTGNFQPIRFDIPNQNSFNHDFATFEKLMGIYKFERQFYARKKELEEWAD